jgi:hypothetical protein
VSEREQVVCDNNLGLDVSNYSVRSAFSGDGRFPCASENFYKPHQWPIISPEKKKERKPIVARETQLLMKSLKIRRIPKTDTFV